MANNLKDFVLENGVLIRYDGNDQQVEIPDGVESIGRYTFCNCNNLTSVTISNGVKSLEEGAFFSCLSLQRIIFNGTKRQWKEIKKGDYWDAQVSNNCVIYCTDKSFKI